MTPTPPHGSAVTERRKGTPAEAEYVNNTIASERDGAVIMLETGPYSLLLIICGLRLAAAHPGMPGWERSVLLAFADTWAGFYDGTPAEDMARTGTMPAAVNPPAEPVP